MEMSPSGRLQSGVILVDKPVGPSSAQVLHWVKRILRVDRIGHAGTLDPLASGLLVVLIGSATRLAMYAESGRKRYTGSIRLGIRTQSDDISGAVLGTAPVMVTQDAVEAAVRPYLGTIEQMPPQVSALKVEGQRAYALVRRGEVVALKMRTVTVSSFAVSLVSDCEVAFSIQCSKGTYIRSLARDVGADLGCGGVLSSLRRVASEPFSVAEAVTVEQLRRSDSPWEFVRPWVDLFQGERVFEVDDREAMDLLHGNEHTLRRLSERLHGTNVGGHVLYGRGQSAAGQAPSALGILVFDGHSWRIGANV